MKSYLTEYVRWANKVEDVVVWERCQKYGSSYQEYLLESEGQGVFAVVISWKSGEYEARILLPGGKDMRAPKGAAESLRSAILAAVGGLIAMEFAGQAIRYEPNPEEVGIG